MADLSPAAQAVLDAAFAPWETTDTPQSIAATIRALADQVVPFDAVEARNSLFMAMEMECQRIRAEILAIATELEGTNDPA